MSIIDMCLQKNTHSSTTQLETINLFSANSHLVQNRLKINVTTIIAYTGYTSWWERATVAQSL